MFNKIRVFIQMLYLGKCKDEKLTSPKCAN